MLAGMQRKRKNAVDKNVTDEEITCFEAGKRPRGRPSKGGEALRAKRYYVKKHLLILQKRKLRRYHLRVKKIIADKHFDPIAVRKELEVTCNQYKSRDNKTASYNDILHAVDIAREDRYLRFLNEEAETLLAALPNNTEYDPARVEKLKTSLTFKHSGRLFQLTTHWSAYLLLHHVTNEVLTKETLNDVQKLEKIQNNCNDYYEIDYSHLKGEELTDTLIPSLDDGDTQGEDEQQQEVVEAEVNEEDESKAEVNGEEESEAEEAEFEEHNLEQEVEETDKLEEEIDELEQEMEEVEVYVKEEQEVVVEIIDPKSKKPRKEYTKKDEKDRKDRKDKKDRKGKTDKDDKKDKKDCKLKNKSRKHKNPVSSFNCENLVF